MEYPIVIVGVPKITIKIVTIWVFRGAVQRRAQPLGRGQAVLLQAALFALQHGSAAAMAYALVCGLGLGWLADRTGHLWPGMLLHSANNLLVLAMG